MPGQPLNCLDIGSFSAPGTRYGELNQDYVAVQELFAPGERIPNGASQVYCLAVCDGHGLLGDKAACYAGKAILRHLYQAPDLRNHGAASVHELVNAAFLKGHACGLDLYESPPSSAVYTKPSGKGTATYSLARTSRGGATSASYSDGKGLEKLVECGCTCTVAVLQGRTLCVANVGDSTAILGSEANGVVAPRVLTVKHNCLNGQEVSRITEQCSANAVKILKDNCYLHIQEGPCAGYQISVTRALCHKHLQDLGVIPQPDIHTLELAADDRCLVLASDGIHDFMTPEEVVKHVMSESKAGKTAAQCAKSLVDMAIKQGLAKSGEADNTSAIVVLF